MVLSLSWKNIWRNKLRSSIIIFAVTLGIIVGTFISAFEWGFMEQRINSVIANELSHIQVHRQDYNLEDLQFQPFDFEERYREILIEEKRIKAFTERIVLGGMISTAQGNLPVRIVGVEVEKEEKVTKIGDELVEGVFFDKLKKNEVVVGKVLAERLGIRLKSKVIIRFHDDKLQENIGAFRVVGIFEKVNDQLEQLQIYVNRDVLKQAKFLNTSQISELAVLLKSNEYLDSVSTILSSSYPDLKVETWAEAMPELSSSLEMYEQIQLIIMGIVMLALAFGIVNTMLMAVLERTKEIGVLMAIGMKKIQIGLMFFLESLFLSLLGLPLGLFFAYIIIGYFSDRGIDLGAFAEGINSFGFDSFVYPIMKKEFYYNISTVVIVISMLASLFPFIKAIRMNPVQALKTS